MTARLYRISLVAVVLALKNVSSVMRSCVASIGVFVNAKVVGVICASSGKRVWN